MSTNTTVFCIPFETWIHIFTFLPVDSICACSQTCSFLNDISLDSMLWRELLRRDFINFNGGFGLDLLQRQENSLTLSQSVTIEDWADAPWKNYYKNNYNISTLRSPTWIYGFNSNINERQDHAGARCGDYLVIYAGFTNDKHLYVLDTKEQVKKLQECSTDQEKQVKNSMISWNKCEIDGDGPKLLSMLYGHTLVTLNSSTLLLYGGMQAPGYQFESSEVWLLHLEEENQENSKKNLPFRWKWEKIQIQGEQIPPARAYHSGVICNDKFWIFGGTWQSKTHNDFWFLDLNTWTWEEVILCENEIIPHSRMGHSCFTFNDNIYIFGGSDNPYCQGYGNDFIDSYCFNCKTLKMRKLPNSFNNSIGRRHGAVLIGNKILFIGGGSPHTNGITYFNLDDETWHKLDDIKGRKPSPRVSLSAHFCNGLIFVFGGCTNFGLSNELFLLDTSDFTGLIEANKFDTSTANDEFDDDYTNDNLVDIGGEIFFLNQFRQRFFQFLGREIEIADEDDDDDEDFEDMEQDEF